MNVPDRIVIPLDLKMLKSDIEFCLHEELVDVCRP